MKKQVWDVSIVGKPVVRIKSVTIEPGAEGTLVFLNGKTGVADVVFIVSLRNLESIERIGEVDDEA